MTTGADRTITIWECSRCQATKEMLWSEGSGHPQPPGWVKLFRVRPPRADVTSSASTVLGVLCEDCQTALRSFLAGDAVAVDTLHPDDEPDVDPDLDPTTT